MIIGTIFYMAERPPSHADEPGGALLQFPGGGFSGPCRRTAAPCGRPGTRGAAHLQKQLMGTVAFNREKMNEPTPIKGLFQEQWLHYYHPDSLKDRNLIVVGFFDPSLESGSSADYKAVVSVGYCQEESVFYVLDAFIQKTTLEQTLRAVFNRHREQPTICWGWRTTFSSAC